MLVITRKVDQAVHLYMPSGEVVRVEVVRNNRDSLRLGFTAPASVRIVRAEIDPCRRSQEGTNDAEGV